jgi:hypothetical protein
MTPVVRHRPFFMVLTVTLAALLAHAPALHAGSASANDAARFASAVAQQLAVPQGVTAPVSPAAKQPVVRYSVLPTPSKQLALELHPMTDEEKKLFPGRERFDKTEWYESLFKSMKIVLLPEHVDEWNNGGREVA